MADYTKKAVRGAGTVFILTACGSFFAYLLRLVLARSLTPIEYGLVYAITNLFGLFVVFRNLGLPTALGKYVPEFIVNDEKTKIKSSILTVMVILLTLSLITSGLSIIFSDFIARTYLNTEDEEISSIASILISMYAIALLFLPIQKVMGYTFVGFQEMKYAALRNPLTMLLTLFSTLIFLHSGYGVKSPIFAYVIGYAATGAICYIILVKKVFPEFHTIKTVFDRILLLKLIKFGIPVILTSFAGIVYGYTDTIILTIFRPLKEVGLYNVGLPTTKILWTMNISLSMVLMPISSELWTRKQENIISKGINKLYKYSFIFIFPFSLLMLLFPEIILNILFGKEYVGAAGVLRILSIGSIAMSYAGINNSVLTGIGRPREVSTIMVSGAVLNFIGNILLIPPFGMDGAAVSTTASFIAVMFLSYRELMKHIRFSLYLRDHLFVLLAGILISGIVCLIKEINGIDVHTKLITSILIGGIAYISILYASGTLRKDDLREIIKRVV